jgi:hypothetical protein
MRGPAPRDAWFLIVRERTDGKPSVEVLRELPRFSPITGLRIVVRISEASVVWNSIDDLIGEILDGTLPLWSNDAKA